VQRTYCYGKESAGSLRDVKKLDLNKDDPHDKCTEKDMDTRKLDQDEFDIMYQAEKNIWRECKLLRRI